MSTPRSLTQLVCVIEYAYSLVSKSCQFVFLQQEITLALLTFNSCSSQYTTLKYLGYQIGVTNCHKGILFLDVF